MRKRLHLSPRNKRAIWSGILILSLVGLAVKFTQPTPPFQTDLLDLLPKSNQLSASQKKAIAAAGQRLNTQLLLLVPEPLAQTKTADRIIAPLTTLPGVSRIQLDITPTNLTELLAIYHTKSFNFLSSSDRRLLDENPTQLAQNAIQKLYSPIGLGPLANLRSDPYLLLPNFVMSWPLPHGEFVLQNGRLIRETAAIRYTLVTLNLQNELSMTEKSSVMASITAHLAQYPDVIATGIPLHSHAGETMAKQDISRIGTLSLLGIILMMLHVFRSLNPLLWTVITIGIGCLTALSASLWLFGQIHILTLVFGASLIGVCIDYACHFFIHRFRENPTSTGSVRHIFPSVTLGLITSIIGYMALLITPFPALKQMAVFSVIGLASAYLTVIWIYPMAITMTPLSHTPKLLRITPALLSWWQTQKRPVLILLGLLGVGSLGLMKLVPQDDIRLLYRPPTTLLEHEKQSRELLNHQLASQFFLITGPSAQAVLEHEEHLASKLQPLVDTKQLIDFQATSRLIPSIKTQRTTFDMVRTQLLTTTHRHHVARLGLPIQTPPSFQPLIIEHDIDKMAKLNPLLDTLWLGQLDDQWASIVTLQGYDIPIDTLATLAQDSIAFINQVDTISDTLSDYRKRTSGLLMLAYVLIFGLLSILKGIKKATWLLLPTLTATVVSLGLLGFFNQPISLFHILALFLILGIGVDYALFYESAGSNPTITGHAVLISAISTLLSFGSLALSQTPAMQWFGLMVFLGILMTALVSPAIVPKKC